MTQDDWTYGAEHELADWDIRTELPDGYGRDTHDITIVNSNGIANDPRGKLYSFGGEINTPPTDTILGQLTCMATLIGLLPEARVNYRSNLHIHIRVPNLGDDLALLKRVQAYIHANMPKVLAQIEPLPRPEGQSSEELKGAQRRWRRRRVSHQTLLTPARLQRQLEATSVEDFYEREVPVSKKGRPLWHLQPRLCVNLRQHRETDTVEFRHFPGTLDLDKLATCISWCRDFLWYALEGRAINTLLAERVFATEEFPTFPPYTHWMENNYRKTVHDGSVSKEQIALNIDSILQGASK